MVGARTDLCPLAFFTEDLMKRHARLFVFPAHVISMPEL